MIPEHNHTFNFTPDRILDNPKSINIKAFCYDFEISWEHTLLKPHKVSLVEIKLVSIPNIKDE